MTSPTGRTTCRVHARATPRLPGRKPSGSGCARNDGDGQRPRRGCRQPGFLGIAQAPRNEVRGAKRREARVNVTFRTHGPATVIELAGDLSGAVALPPEVEQRVQALFRPGAEV